MTQLNDPTRQTEPSVDELSDPALATNGSDLVDRTLTVAAAMTTAPERARRSALYSKP